MIAKGWRNFGITMAVGVIIGIALAVWKDAIFGVFVVAFFLIPALAIRSAQGKKWSGKVAEIVMPSVRAILAKP